MIPTMGYEQIYARVVIDTKEELTEVCAVKPSRTPKIGPGSTEVETQQSSSALDFSGLSIQPILSGHLGTESFSYLIRNHGSRITQGDGDGVIWWGFDIDDPHERGAGKELLDILPSVEFEFIGENASLPEWLHVEVASVWSLISSNKLKKQSWQELINVAKPKGLSHSNLCQIVQLEIPSVLLKNCKYKSIIEVPSRDPTPDIKLFRGSDLVRINTSVRFSDGPVPPGSEPFKYIQ